VGGVSVSARRSRSAAVLPSGIQAARAAARSCRSISAVRRWAFPWKIGSPGRRVLSHAPTASRVAVRPGERLRGEPQQRPGPPPGEPAEQVEHRPARAVQPLHHLGGAAGGGEQEVELLDGDRPPLPPAVHLGVPGRQPVERVGRHPPRLAEPVAEPAEGDHPFVAGADRVRRAVPPLALRRPGLAVALQVGCRRSTSTPPGCRRAWRAISRRNSAFTRSAHIWLVPFTTSAAVKSSTRSANSTLPVGRSGASRPSRTATAFRSLRIAASSACVLLPKVGVFFCRPLWSR
jgi:hypothetical protein